MTKQRRVPKSEPLRKSGEINLVRNLMECKTKEPLRNRLIFDIGINNGLRTIDILHLKTDDVLGKNQIRIKETKTGKMRTVRFNGDIQAEIKEYVDHRQFNSEWLFPSYKDHRKPISTQAVYRMFRRISQGVPGLEGLTAHSMRRTFGYHFYKKTHDIATLMKIFNHSSQSITLRYIGIEKEDIDDELADFKL